jgi:hypothetical protein
MKTLYNPLLDGDQYHNDEVTVIGPATIRGQVIDRINLVTIDTEAAARRNIGYIRENIAARKAREEKENRDAAGN